MIVESPDSLPGEASIIADVPLLFESKGRLRTLSIRLPWAGNSFPVFVPSRVGKRGLPRPDSNGQHMVTTPGGI
jgi:hypothetical protein